MVRRTSTVPGLSVFSRVIRSRLIQLCARGLLIISPAGCALAAAWPRWGGWGLGTIRFLVMSKSVPS